MTVAAEDPQEENNILSTRQYGIFRFDPANRPIDPKHLGELIEAIQEENLLHLFPIIVSRNFVVTDGQHRLRAAEFLNLPIYYIISDRMRQEHARKLSKLNKNWSVKDNLHHWCELGLTDYRLLREFWAEHRWLTLTSAASLATTGPRGGRSFKIYFDEGLYKANNLDFARRVCSYILDFKTWIPFYREKAFVATITIIARNPEYNHDRMMQKMKYQSSRLTKQANADSYFDIINDIYNFRVVEENRYYFRKPIRKVKEDS